MYASTQINFFSRLATALTRCKNLKNSAKTQVGAIAQIRQRGVRQAYTRQSNWRT